MFHRLSFWSASRWSRRCWSLPRHSRCTCTCASKARNHDLRCDAPADVLARPSANALDALESASVARRVLLPRDGQTCSGRIVDQMGRYPAVGATGWVFKLNGVSPPVGRDQATLKDGDTVLWYWAQFGVAGGPTTLAPRKRAARGCYTVLQQDDAGQRRRGERCTSCRSDRSGRCRRSGRAASARTRASSERRSADAVRSNALA